MEFSIDQLTIIREEYGDDVDDFCVQLHCEVTSPSTRGGEAFDVTVISPARMQADLEASSNDVEFGRGYVIMRDFDQSALRRELQKLIDGSGASTWAELHNYITRYFDWV